MQKSYIAYYHHKDGDVCSVIFSAHSVKEAKQHAQFHKRHNKELKNTITEVRLKK